MGTVEDLKAELNRLGRERNALFQTPTEEPVKAPLGVDVLADPGHPLAVKFMKDAALRMARERLRHFRIRETTRQREGVGERYAEAVTHRTERRCHWQRILRELVDSEAIRAEIKKGLRLPRRFTRRSQSELYMRVRRALLEKKGVTEDYGSLSVEAMKTAVQANSTPEEFAEHLAEEPSFEDCCAYRAALRKTSGSSSRRRLDKRAQKAMGKLKTRSTFARFVELAPKKKASARGAKKEALLEERQRRQDTQDKPSLELLSAEGVDVSAELAVIYERLGEAP